METELIRKIPKIGRGSKMSIAKAALIYYYGEFAIETGGVGYFLTYGDLEAMHKIIDIAGAKHCSFFTAAQVSSCLGNSPYWNKELISGFYSGMRGHGGANCYKPSEKGEKYYKEVLSILPKS